MLRLIHSLGGCGGTLLSRCIGVLDQVSLLSEVNPGSVKLFPDFDPLFQDAKWLHLLTEEDLQRFAGADFQQIDAFRELIQVFYNRASARGRNLVVRDYNYVEFIGTPFRADPPRRLLLRAAVPEAVPVVSVALIRHPVDQWLSLCKHQEVATQLTPRAFSDAYASFLLELEDIAIFKYEEFVDNPERQLSSICETLHLQFSSGFLERFYRFDSVTGDLTRLHDHLISPPVQRCLPAEALEGFRATDSFRWILEKANYPESLSYATDPSAGYGALMGTSK